MSRKRLLAAGVASGAAIAAVAAAITVEATAPPASRSAAPTAASAPVRTAKLTMAEAKTASTAAAPTISQISGGGGVINFSGQANGVALNTPSAVAVDGKGDVFIADTENNMVREITASGIIETVAGEPGKFGDADDGGQAVRAELSASTDVAVDAAGKLYIADSGNNALREVSASGVISTLAGGNGEGNDGLGAAVSAAQLDTPESVAVDSSTGDVYVTSRSGVLDQITGLLATS